MCYENKLKTAYEHVVSHFHKFFQAVSQVVITAYKFQVSQSKHVVELFVYSKVMGSNSVLSMKQVKTFRESLPPIWVPQGLRD